MSDPASTIAFQGMPGAYSHLACREVHPAMTALPCPTFEAMLEAVTEGRARLAMVPVENSLAGRVADIHHLLPESGLHIVAEHFQRVNHHLLAPKGATLEGLREVHSHAQALAQCRGTIRKLGIAPVVHTDTAGAAHDVAEWGDPTKAAVASSLAAETYGLAVLRESLEDALHNTTRFIVMARELVMPPRGNGVTVTTLVFRVRSVPAALYKALGGFATNGINLTKLESYMLGGSFEAAQFYVDAEGHPEDVGMQHALDELRFFCPEGAVKMLGAYPAHPFRVATRAKAEEQ